MKIFFRKDIDIVYRSTAFQNRVHKSKNHFFFQNQYRGCRCYHIVSHRNYCIMDIFLFRNGRIGPRRCTNEVHYVYLTTYTYFNDTKTVMSRFYTLKLRRLATPPAYFMFRVLYAWSDIIIIITQCINTRTPQR